MLGTDPGPAVAADQKRLGRLDGLAPHGDVPQRRAPIDLDHPGWATPPLIVTRQVPGSSAIPRARKGPGPCRAMRATWANVSALCTRAGRLPMRSGVPLSGRNTGQRAR